MSTEVTNSLKYTEIQIRTCFYKYSLIRTIFNRLIQIKLSECTLVESHFFKSQKTNN